LPPGMHCSLEFRLGAALALSSWLAPLVVRRARAAQSYRRPRRVPTLLTVRFSIPEPAREKSIRRENPPPKRRFAESQITLRILEPNRDGMNICRYLRVNS